jgi:hypothetical protein
MEDLVISRDLLIDSVNVVNFVNRGNRLSNMSDALVCQDTRDDYNTHVFKNVGFEVIDVKLFAWPQDGSSFIYGATKNPNLAKGVPVPTIISILAKRK